MTFPKRILLVDREPQVTRTFGTASLRLGVVVEYFRLVTDVISEALHHNADFLWLAASDREDVSPKTATACLISSSGVRCLSNALTL
jgi:hypothetical protein